MKYILTSSASVTEGYQLNPKNQLIDRLMKELPQKPLDCIYISSDPDAYDITDEYASYTRLGFEEAGFMLKEFIVYDHRILEPVEMYLEKADFVILSGGHVPTQQHFFEEIQLKEYLANYAGLILGISAGSMNFASEVYSCPEAPGEAKDPTYQRFISGLGYTKQNILPHFNELKEEWVDDLKVIEEIVMPDSQGHTFLAFPDGTYLLGKNGQETIYGECYQIEDGSMTQISCDGEEYML